MAKITFVVNETTFKVAMITSSEVNIFFVVTEIIFLLEDTSFLVTKIIFVMAEIRVKRGCDYFFSDQDHFCSG